MATPHIAGAAALCISSGAYSGLTSNQIIAKFRTDAANQPLTYGFISDPNSPSGSRYYGHLIHTSKY